MEAVESFLTNVRGVIRTRQMSLRTEDAYLYRIRQFIEFHGKRQTATRPRGSAPLLPFLLFLYLPS